MKVHYKTINLPFQYPFTISGGRTKTHQPSLIIALSLGPFTGYGEAPAITYYNITVEQMIADLESKKNYVEKFAFTEPERYWHYLHHLFPKNYFLVCALDIAAWDLYGKMRNAPLYKLWNTEWSSADATEKANPLTDYTIGIDTIDKMLEKIKDKTWPIYKIKVGTEDDIAVIKALRIELIEQPLQKNNWEEMKILYEHSPLPLFADESCVFENDVEKCVGYFHGINIKLTKCGGITPALRMIQNARQHGLKVMMGSMNESTVGSAAMANFLPQLDYADMDGPLLLAEDTAAGLLYDFGKIRLSGKPGMGIELI